MNIYGKRKLERVWLSISTISLLLPILLNYGGFDAENFNIAVTVVLAILFAGSMPLSILALPFLAGFRYGIELDLNSMFGTYFFIVLLNAFGYVQWFWLAPKFFDRGKEFKLPTILEGN